MKHPEFRPPAVPLVVCDPYLSVWSMSDTLTESWSKHWTGKEQGMCGLIRIDGAAYRFMGQEPRYLTVALPPMPQTSLEVWPTRTIYHFEAAGLRLKLTFLNPLLPHDLELMARPLVYVAMEVEATDGQAHEVALYLDVGSSWVVNTPEQRVVWGRHHMDGQDLLWMGTAEQPMLRKSGDDLRIDWGYLYFTAPPEQEGSSGINLDTVCRATFASSGTLSGRDDIDMPRIVGNRPPTIVAAWSFDLGQVGSQPVSRSVLIAYDDQYSVEYMHRRLRPYWRRDGSNAADLIETAIREYSQIAQRCQRYDQELVADLTRMGGEAYARLAVLAYRQCIAAHKLVVEMDGTPLFFSKENFSNGCMGTVDVTYPSSPFFLLFNPDLLQAQLMPVLEYAASPQWPFPFAPHDVGRYPLANGQVYGGPLDSEAYQMPVEECGNMLLLMAGLCKARGGDVAFAQVHWTLLRQWASYLRDKGLDPDNQLCTDDFAGHLAHNVNLSLKAILALAAYAQMCKHNNLPDEAATFRGHAERMAARWLTMATDGDHYRLAFDVPGTWSQKYNLVWDRLLGLNLFPASIMQKEIAFYKTKQGRYGLPLDNRNSYTKLDWIVWSASMAAEADFKTFIEPLHDWLNETTSRVPLCDWYYTDSGLQRGFQARSVVGGVFIKLLYDADLWHKWRNWQA